MLQPSQREERGLVSGTHVLTRVSIECSLRKSKRGEWGEDISGSKNGRF